MYLIDEEHIVRLQVGQQSCQIPGLVDDRSGSGPHVDPHLVADDVRQGRLAQTWRTVQQDVVQRLPTRLGRMHEHHDVVNDLLLSLEFLEQRRAYGALKLLVA